MTRAEFSRLLEEATPGPWTWTGNENVGYPFGDKDAFEDAGEAHTEADVDLIVALHNIAPDLLVLWEAAERAADFASKRVVVRFFGHAFLQRDWNDPRVQRLVEERLDVLIPGRRSKPKAGNS